MFFAYAGITNEDGVRSSSRDPAGPACADFIIAVSDAQDGILTDAEFRAEMQTVLETAEGTRVEPLVRDVLAALTSGTPTSCSTPSRRSLGPAATRSGSDLAPPLARPGGPRSGTGEAPVTTVTRAMWSG